MINISIICLIIIAAIPIKQSLYWLYKNSIAVHNQLEKKKIRSHCSLIPFLECTIISLKFIKGFYIPFTIKSFNLNNELIIAAIIITMLTELWSPFTLFKKTTQWQFTLWGILTFISPLLFLIYPLSFIIFSLLINSFHIGQLLSITTIIGILWILNLNPYYLLASTCLFILILLFLTPHFQQGLTNKRLDIKTSFIRRNKP
ncbi:MAG: hypothetical protein VW378_03990 [bacterium]